MKDGANAPTAHMAHALGWEVVNAFTFEQYRAASNATGWFQKPDDGSPGQ